MVSSLCSNVGVAVAVGIAVAVAVGSGVGVDADVTVGVNVKVGAEVVSVGMGVRVLVGVDVIVGVAVSVGVSVVADAVDCAIEASIGLAVLAAVGIGGRSDATTGSGVRVAVTDGVALGKICAARSDDSSTCTGVGAGVLIPCCSGNIILLNTSFLADSATTDPIITPTSTTNAAIRQGRWRRRTARQ